MLIILGGPFGGRMSLYHASYVLHSEYLTPVSQLGVSQGGRGKYSAVPCVRS